MTPEQARAAAAIVHTQSVYTTGGDRGRLDELASAFTSAGVLEFYKGAFTGRAAIAAALGEGFGDRADGRLGFVRHHLTTRRIEFDGADAADAWTYFLVLTPPGLDHGGR
jgi:hypothetical protein